MNRRNSKARQQKNGRSYGPVMLTGLFLGLVAAGGFWVWQQLRDPQTLPFHEIRILGQFQHLNPVQLRNTLRPQINGGFFVLKLNPLKQSLLTIPWVEEVSIRRIPGILYVNVHEHQPVARWNKLFLINSHDQLFPVPIGAPIGLPALYGPEEAEPLILDQYKQINLTLKPIHLQIKQLVYDERQNWQLILSNDLAVTAGREDVLTKMRRLVHWYPQMVNDKLGPVTHIDLRYPNSIAVSR